MHTRGLLEDFLHSNILDFRFIVYLNFLIYLVVFVFYSFTIFITI